MNQPQLFKCRTDSVLIMTYYDHELADLVRGRMSEENLSCIDLNSFLNPHIDYTQLSSYEKICYIRRFGNMGEPLQEGGKPGLDLVSKVLWALGVPEDHPWIEKTASLFPNFLYPPEDGISHEELQQARE